MESRAEKQNRKTRSERGCRKRICRKQAYGTDNRMKQEKIGDTGSGVPDF